MAHVIYPYGPPIERAENLWQIIGTLKFPVPRNMTIVRNRHGELLIYSAIAMHEEGMRLLEALGRPAVMVIPHRRHQMDAAFYKARYPALRVLAPDAGRVRHVAVDGGLAELAEFGVQAYVLPGNTYEDVVLDIPLPGGRALCVCETLGNVAPPPGLASVLFRLLGPPGGSFGIARAVRLREVRGTAQLRAWLETQAERADVRCLLFGHGEPLTSDIPDALRRAAAQL
ncbi:MAG TPA: hypothetical protein VJV79_26465 [Polyangiaceae bacterium]|nr:hypothetical protein [Polyangiaceae bacterium]